MDYITGIQAKKDFEEKLWYANKKTDTCACGCGKEIIQPVEVKIETETGERLEFYYSTECAIETTLKPVA